jgi:oxygen-dependent protoporphyrinogen oxidase
LTLRVAVIGGGIAGLTAAYRLRGLLGPAASITVFESTQRLGGKLQTVDVDGVPVDVGAEAFLVRRPEALELVEELGLGGRLVCASGARPTVRAGGRTAELPRRTLMGIPADAGEVDGVLSTQGVAAVAAEASLPRVELPARADVNLGELVRVRFGDELVDRLVSPLLASVYGASADVLGLRAVLPAVADAVDRGAPSLTAAARALLPAPSASSTPVFGTLRGGLGVLVDRLAAVARATILPGTPVQALSRTPDGWVVQAAEQHVVDGVVLAVPAPAARRLLSGVSDAAAYAYGEVDQASMAVVTLALPAGSQLPQASGVLIEDGQRRADGSQLLSKAMTFSSRKWQHVGESGVFLRASVGRYGSREELRLTDDALVDGVRADLADLTGITVEPQAAVVQRWGGGLPHYGVEHLARVARIERAVAEQPGLEVAGAVLHGVGIPACIGTGDAAARRLAAELKVEN